MEEDRAVANIGPDISGHINQEPDAVPKVPKKRFIGRRAAAERAATKAGENGSIEDSGALQGM